MKLQNLIHPKPNPVRTEPCTIASEVTLDEQPSSRNFLEAWHRNSSWTDDPPLLNVSRYVSMLYYDVFVAFFFLLFYVLIYFLHHVCRFSIRLSSILFWSWLALGLTSFCLVWCISKCWIFLCLFLILIVEWNIDFHDGYIRSNMVHTWICWWVWCVCGLCFLLMLVQMFAH